MAGKHWEVFLKGFIVAAPFLSHKRTTSLSDPFACSQDQVSIFHTVADVLTETTMLKAGEGLLRVLNDNIQYCPPFSFFSWGVDI